MEAVQAEVGSVEVLGPDGLAGEAFSVEWGLATPLTHRRPARLN